MSRPHICKRCYRPYADAARGCPRCGPTIGQRLAGLLRSLKPQERVILAGVALAIMAIPIARQRLAEAEAQRAAERDREAQIAQSREAACRADAKCWGERHIVGATIACRRAAEAQARYSVRWPEGWLAREFPGVDWHDREAGTLTYVGFAEFQNGFNAWTPYIIGCLYDPATDSVVRTELKPGRP
jgi:predicted  nucleic acid-binding Zn-ribbon protein